MPRVVKKKKTQYRVEYSQGTLELAVRRINDQELSVRQAAAMYNVPKSTLHDKVKGNVPLQARSGPMPNLTMGEEDAIERWIVHMSRIGYGQTRRELKHVVKKILDEDGRATSFVNNMPGRDWFERFMDRHPNLSQRCGEALGTERALLTKEKVDAWYREFEAYILTNPDMNGKGAELLGDPRRIFNCDESGFPLAGKAGEERVLAEKGARNVYQLSNSDRRQITVLACMSAAGTYVPPMLIYPGVRFSYNPLNNAPEDFVLGRSASGWMDSEVFYEWAANHFLPFVKRQSIPLPVLLLLDGHSSHVNVQLADFCSKNGIILYCFQPHASHIMQPCDLTLFRALKGKWQSKVKEFVTTNVGQTVTKPTFAKVFAEAWKEAAKPSVAVNGFRAAGIYPFNPAAYDQSKVLPGEALNPSAAPPPRPHLPLPETPAQAADNTQVQPQPLPLPDAPVAGAGDAQPEPAQPQQPRLQSEAPSVTAATAALAALEGVMSEEKLWLFAKRFREGYDIDTDALYNAWKRLKERTQTPTPVSQEQAPPTTAVSSSTPVQASPEASTSRPVQERPGPSSGVSDAFRNHLRYPQSAAKSKPPRGPQLPKAVSGSKFRAYLQAKEAGKRKEEERKQKNREVREAKRRQKEQLELEKNKPTESAESSEEDEEVNDSICAKCGKKYRGEWENKKWLGCVGCPRWYHRWCTDITDVDRLTEAEVREIEWLCPKCL